MPRGARARSLLAFCSALFAVQPARAQEHGGYSVGPNCPAESEFWTLVESHLRNPSARDALTVRVEASELEGQALARVTFGSEEGAAAREVSAATCLEAVQAAALVVALALDSRAQEQQSAVPPPRPPPIAPPPPRTEPRRAPALPDAAPRRAPRRPSALSSGVRCRRVDPASDRTDTAVRCCGVRRSRPSRLGRRGAGRHRLRAVRNDGKRGRVSRVCAPVRAATSLWLCALTPPKIRRGSLSGRPDRTHRKSRDRQRAIRRQIDDTPLGRLRPAASRASQRSASSGWRRTPDRGFRSSGRASSYSKIPRGNHSFHEVPAVGFTGGLAVALRLD